MIENDYPHKDEYSGLDDTDRFAVCSECGIANDQDEIIDFGGELFCRTCLENKSTRMLTFYDRQATETMLLEFLREELEKRGLHIEELGIKKAVTADDETAIICTLGIKAGSHRRPATLAKILAEKIVATHKTAATLLPIEKYR